MIYVVLGMHKSGTSLAAQILHASGINMVESLDPEVGYGPGNTWERASVVDVNRQLLIGHLNRPMHFRLLERIGLVRGRFGTVPHHPSLSIVRSLPRSLTPEQRTRLRAVVDGCERRHLDWGFKDPRTCLTYPLWREELPEHRLIIVFRSCREVLGHYGVAGWGQVRVARLLRALRTWSAYNRLLLEHAEAAVVPVLVIPYERLMTEPSELDRLREFVGRDLADTRDPALYRVRARATDPLPSLAAALSRALAEPPGQTYRRLMERSTLPADLVPEEQE